MDADITEPRFCFAGLKSVGANIREGITDLGGTVSRIWEETADGARCIDGSSTGVAVFSARFPRMILTPIRTRMLSRLRSRWSTNPAISSTSFVKNGLVRRTTSTRWTIRRRWKTSIPETVATPSQGGPWMFISPSTRRTEVRRKYYY